MYFLLFGFWVLLNGQWTAEIAIVGLIVCAALYAFMCAFMGYSPKQEWRIAKRLPLIVGYFFYLVGEVFKSAWGVMKLIWSELFYSMGLDKDEITRRKADMENNRTLKNLCDTVEAHTFAYNDRYFATEAPRHNPLPHYDHDFYMEAIAAATKLPVKKA